MKDSIRKLVLLETNWFMYFETLRCNGVDIGYRVGDKVDIADKEKRAAYMTKEELEAKIPIYITNYINNDEFPVKVIESTGMVNAWMPRGLKKWTMQN